MALLGFFLFFIEREISMKIPTTLCRGLDQARAKCLIRFQIGMMLRKLKSSMFDDLLAHVPRDRLVAAVLVLRHGVQPVSQVPRLPAHRTFGFGSGSAGTKKIGHRSRPTRLQSMTRDQSGGHSTTVIAQASAPSCQSLIPGVSKFFSRKIKFQFRCCRYLFLQHGSHQCWMGSNDY